MQRYRAIRKCLLGGRLYNRGEVAEFEAVPSRHWEPADQPPKPEPRPLFIPPDQPPPLAAGSPRVRSAYHEQGRAALMVQAKERGIEGYGGMKQAQLIAALEADDKRLLEQVR